MTYLCHPENSQRRFAIWRNGAFLFQCYSGFFLSSGCSFSGGVLRGLASGTGRWSCRSVAGGGAGLASGRCTGLEDGCGGGMTGFGGVGSGAFCTAGFGGAALGDCSCGCMRRSGAGGGAGLASGRCTGLEDGCGGGLTGCGEGVAGLGCGSPGWARRSGAGDASGAAGLGAGRSG